MVQIIWDVRIRETQIMQAPLYLVVDLVGRVEDTDAHPSYQSSFIFLRRGGQDRLFIRPPLICHFCFVLHYPLDSPH